MDAAKGLRSFVQRYFETAGGNRGIKTSPLGEIVATMENWIKWKSSLVVQRPSMPSRSDGYLLDMLLAVGRRWWSSVQVINLEQ
jgi:hypothetical protein